jgi:hypothetical protein
MPHSGGALPSLSTKAIPSPLLACDSGLANAGPTAIIRVGRLGNDRSRIESFDEKPDRENQLEQASWHIVKHIEVEAEEL